MKKKVNLLQYCFLLILVIPLLSNCTNEKDDPKPVVDCSKSGLLINVDNIEAASGCASSDASVSVSAEGGEGEITFSIDNGAFQSSGTFSNLSAGNFTITAKDDNGCEVSTEVPVGVEGATLAISSVSVTVAGCEDSNGQLSVTAAGDGIILYKLNEGSFQASSTFSGLTAGIYTVTIKDDTDCEVSSQKKVLNGTSYEQQVKEIIMTNCAISGCHNGDNGSDRNWTVFSNVQNKAARIKELTQDGTMPLTGSITEEEKALIACWVDDGALDN
ncbi:hypothetical protein C900_01969 [Fulvivirga imtechensis AK7]|uniref:SprB repeat-containing protein n=1 Tax=Fulvivirga imtechensis AK7 TaxID=1237149 RepID=L8JWI1_9BACT|nr:hypothetical protein [Fulvivirga imtechensis]ELR71974.1 hypothetical protein C900_01969 [Fulvivirga imtechensis AK7]